MADESEKPQAESLSEGLQHPPKQPAPRGYTTPRDGLLETYCNYININWGPLDVRIRFGQVIPISGQAEAPLQPPQRVIEERVAVTMEWHEAKALGDMLTDAVERYEKVNGELKIPKLPA